MYRKRRDTTCYSGKSFVRDARTEAGEAPIVAESLADADAGLAWVAAACFAGILLVLALEALLS